MQVSPGSTLPALSYFSNWRHDANSPTPNSNYAYWRLLTRESHLVLYYANQLSLTQQFVTRLHFNENFTFLVNILLFPFPFRQVFAYSTLIHRKQIPITLYANQLPFKQQFTTDSAFLTNITILHSWKIFFSPLSFLDMCLHIHLTLIYQHQILITLIGDSSLEGEPPRPLLFKSVINRATIRY